MFRSVSSEGHLSGGQSSPPAAGPGVTSPGLDSQESSWIGLLSVFSRPAWSFLQKYLPGRPRTPALSEDRAAWMSGDLNPGKTMFVDEEREFLRQLDDMMPLTQHAAPHLTYLRCQQDSVAGLLEPKGGGSLPWLTADSLREIGIESAEDVDINLVQQTQMGHLSSIRTFLSHVWLSSVSSQEIKPTVGTDWVSQSSGGNKSRTWWGSFWGGEESSQRALLLSDPSWDEDGTRTGRLCPQQPAADTKAAQTAAVFVQSVGGGSRGWTLGENTGPSDHKDELDHNGGLHLVQNTEGSSSDRRLSITNHLNASGAATTATCSEVTLLTPDQDNGYSSLEEEHIHMCQLFMVNAPRDPPPPQEAEPAGTRAAGGTDMEEKTSDDAESTSGNIDEEEEEEDEEAAAQEDQCAAAAAEGEEAVFATPQCQNKAIAFIMGCPCSDDDSSQSDSDSSDDDDDGFDSEGSSDLSDSTDEDDENDEDDEDSDGEVDSEAERLWSSMCQSQDPYNPRNFTARLHTSSTPPKTIPASTPPSSAKSSPASSPDVNPLPLPSSSSPPSGLEVWDDSTSASEADEAESLRLWSSFSCSSDPYSPFNFQAPLRTRGPAEAGPRARARAKKASQIPPRSPRHAPTSPPEYRKEEAEERLDSGFSEPFASSSTSCSTSSSTRSCSSLKKVRFCDDVEEFFASCGEEEEDRRGPWEELARDRCRFLRRCQEVEQSIAYCLQPQHRRLVYHRLTVLYAQDV